MLKWTRRLFKIRPSREELFERYWTPQPGLLSFNIGAYNPIPSGWLYEGLFRVERKVSGRYKYADVYSYQVLGSGSKGWYRHQLVVF